MEDLQRAWGGKQPSDVDTDAPATDAGDAAVSVVDIDASGIDDFGTLVLLNIVNGADSDTTVS